MLARVLLLATVALAVWAPSATAASVVARDGALVYQADPGEANRLDAEPASSSTTSGFSFTDPGAKRFGQLAEGCSASGTSVDCFPARPGEWERVELELGDRDDIGSGGSLISVGIDGGVGDDTLSLLAGTVRGGPGSDTIYAGGDPGVLIGPVEIDVADGEDDQVFCGAFTAIDIDFDPDDTVPGCVAPRPEPVLEYRGRSRVEVSRTGGVALRFECAIGLCYGTLAMRYGGPHGRVVARERVSIEGGQETVRLRLSRAAQRRLSREQRAAVYFELRRGGGDTLRAGWVALTSRR